MKTVIAFIILSPFLLYFINQPSVDRTLQYRDQVLQKKAFEAAHLASLEGRLTPEIEKKIKDDLEALYFNPNKITLTGPDTITSRGELIEITLRYPQGPTEIFNLFGSDPQRDYYYPVTIMSEYIEGQAS